MASDEEKQLSENEKEEKDAPADPEKEVPGTEGDKPGVEKKVEEKGPSESEKKGEEKGPSENEKKVEGKGSPESEKKVEKAIPEKADEISKEEETKSGNQPRSTKPQNPTECAACGKALKKKLWYFRNGAFYCTKKCYKRKAEEERKKAEEEKKKAEEEKNKAEEEKKTEEAKHQPTD